MLEAPLGFNQEAVITLNFPTMIRRNTCVFKSKLQNYTGVQNVSFIHVPGHLSNITTTNFGYDGKTRTKASVSTALQLLMLTTLLPIKYPYSPDRYTLRPTPVVASW